MLSTSHTQGTRLSVLMASVIITLVMNKITSFTMTGNYTLKISSATVIECGDRLSCN